MKPAAVVHLPSYILLLLFAAGTGSGSICEPLSGLAIKQVAN